LFSTAVATGFSGKSATLASSSSRLLLLRKIENHTSTWKSQTPTFVPPPFFALGDIVPPFVVAISQSSQVAQLGAHERWASQASIQQH
jgi:hypothetical protein